MLSACVTGEPTRNELVSDQIIEPPAHIRLVKGGGAFSSCADKMRVSEELRHYKTNKTEDMS